MGGGGQGSRGCREKFKLTSGREKMIWGRENCKNCREKEYNGYIYPVMPMLCLFRVFMLCSVFFLDKYSNRTFVSMDINVLPLPAQECKAAEERE